MTAAKEEAVMRACLLVLFLSGCGEAMTTDAGVDAGRDAGPARDAGSVGGGDAGACQAAPAFTAAELNGKAGFDPGGPTSLPFNFATMSRAADAGRFDVMFNELYAGAVVDTVPIPASSYRACTLCYAIRVDCDTMGLSCAKSYLAQAGSVTVSEATRSPDAGRYAFQLRNVVYQRWDFASDTPLDGGCLFLGNFSFSGNW